MTSYKDYCNISVADSALGELRSELTADDDDARRLRHCATGRKVAGSIPDGVIGIFHVLNPFSRTMALGSTLPLTEMSTRDISPGR